MLSTLLWVLALSPPPFQDAVIHELGEGELFNDVFVPVARDAEVLLARGDEAYAALLGGVPPADPERAWRSIFEDWHAALAASVCGDGVGPRTWRGAPDVDSPWPDPDGTAGGGSAGRPVRRTEGVEVAVLRRLGALTPVQRAPWSARFAPLADEDLRAAGDASAALGEVERRHPATTAAARAALSLGERELEAGRAELALAWLERAERHTLLAGERELSDAIERRRALARELRARSERGAETWQSATELEFEAEIPLEDLGKRTFLYRPRPASPIQPRLDWNDDGLAVIQTEENVVVLDPRAARVVAAFSPAEVLADFGRPVELLDPPRAAPGWSSRPAAGEGRIVVVLRSRPSVVMCVRLGKAEVFGGPRPAQLEWAVLDGVHVHARERERGGRELAGWPGGRVQPGPLVLEGRAFVQVQGDEEDGAVLESHLACLDLASGRLLWSRFLARGTSLASDRPRFASGAPEAVSAQPLTRVGARVLVGTHLGAAALVEAADGRLDWSLKTRRRPDGASGWAGDAPPAFEEPAGVLLAPADSDRLYWLRGEPDLEGRGLFLHPPRAIGQAVVLAGGDAAEAVLLARSGRERTLASWNGRSGAVREAPWLAPREVFTGGAVLSSGRVLFASDHGVYLHDRTRELYLLDYAPFPTRYGAAGGGVAARGDRVLVFGPHLAWVLIAR